MRIAQRNRPEAELQAQWIAYLQARNWVCKATHGSMYQSGFPDMWITHRQHGGKWVEVKLKDMKGSRFTASQKEWFPKLSANGTPIWILTTVCEHEYRKLFHTENWLEYFTLKGW